MLCEAFCDYKSTPIKFCCLVAVKREKTEEAQNSVVFNGFLVRSYKIIKEFLILFYAMNCA